MEIVKGRKCNKHGVQWKNEGNFLFIYTDRGKMAYIKWLDPDIFTKQMIEEDLNIPFPFKDDTMMVEMSAKRSIEVPVDIMKFSRVNKHGVEFNMNGAKFLYDGFVYEVGLPYQVDMSHSYTPELLIYVMEEFGTFSHHSQMWVKSGIKNKAIKTT